MYTFNYKEIKKKFRDRKYIFDYKKILITNKIKN